MSAHCHHVQHPAFFGKDFFYPMIFQGQENPPHCKVAVREMPACTVCGIADESAAPHTTRSHLFGRSQRGDVCLQKFVI